MPFLLVGEPVEVCSSGSNKQAEEEEEDAAGHFQAVTTTECRGCCPVDSQCRPETAPKFLEVPPASCSGQRGTQLGAIERSAGGA